MTGGIRRRHALRRTIWLGVSLVAAGCRAATPTPGPAELLAPVVIDRYPHDPAAFTQGLVWDGQRLLESTGLEGESTLREVDVTSGAVLRRHDLPADVFGEGLALVDGTLVQLSWQEGRAFTYDRATFAPGPEHRYAGEGWGLCYDGRRLVMSDGSDRLTFRDATTFAPTGTITVTLDGVPVTMLNELECVDDRVYANVWQTDRIVVVDPATGRVTAAIDAAELRASLVGAGQTAIDVLNGIAYDPKDKTFLVTGKLWPTLFRVRFEAGPASP